MGGRFFNHGQPVAEYLATVFTELIRTEHLALGTAVASGQQQVCVTHTGQLRYTGLNRNGVQEGHHGG